MEQGDGSNIMNTDRITVTKQFYIFARKGHVRLKRTNMNNNKEYELMRKCKQISDYIANIDCTCLMSLHLYTLSTILSRLYFHLMK